MADRQAQHSSAHAESRDHSRLFSQGSGAQYNIERAYIDSEANPLAASLVPIDQWPLVRAVDPFDLGVHRCDGSLTPYVGRDSDISLRERVLDARGRGEPLLLLGESTAGKTRSAYEHLLASFPNHRVFLPDNSDALRNAALTLLTCKTPVVVFLDNLERFLPGGLTRSLIVLLKERNIPVIATMRTGFFKKYDSLSPGLLADEHESATVDVLSLLPTVIVQRTWSGAELERASTSSDRRVRDAYLQRDKYGIAEYIAAAPRLSRVWQLAQDSSVPEERLAHRLVQWAIRLADLGAFPVPRALLEAATETLPDLRAREADPDMIERAIDWAKTVRFGAAPLLREVQANEFEAFDYLVDPEPPTNDTDGDLWDMAFRYFRDNNRPDQVSAMAYAAQQSGTTYRAEVALRYLAENGDGASAFSLGILLGELDRLEESIQWLSTSVANGFVAACVALGLSQEKMGDPAAAERSYRVGMEAGDAHATTHLGLLLKEQGRTAEATQLLRSASPDDSEAMTGLGLLLSELGQVEEARERLEVAAATGDLAARNALGIFWDDLKKPRRAESVWLAAAADGSVIAGANLSLLYLKLDRFKDAKRWHDGAVGKGVAHLDFYYGLALLDAGQNAQAQKHLERAVQAGDNEALLALSSLLTAAQPKRALALAEQALNIDLPGALGAVAAAQFAVGEDQAALENWNACLLESDTRAIATAGHTLFDAGRHDEALPFLMEIHSAERGLVACKIASVFHAKGDALQYLQWLETSSSLGHSHADCVLGTALLSTGEFDRAELHLKAAFTSGQHSHAASDLAKLYSRTGHPKRAERWRKAGIGSKASGSRKNTARPKAQNKKRR